jgi:hypothetical protein
MSGLPQDAIDAGKRAIRALYPHDPTHDETLTRDVTAILKTAAPNIAAAERERIRQLAVSKGAYYATEPHGMPYASFADLLAEPEAPDAA